MASRTSCRCFLRRHLAGVEPWKRVRVSVGGGTHAFDCDPLLLVRASSNLLTSSITGEGSLGRSDDGVQLDRPASAAAGATRRGLRPRGAVMGPESDPRGRDDSTGTRVNPDQIVRSPGSEDASGMLVA